VVKWPFLSPAAHVGTDCAADQSLRQCAGRLGWKCMGSAAVPAWREPTASSAAIP
jgi:hypothetical protein